MSDLFAAIMELVASVASPKRRGAKVAVGVVLLLLAMAMLAALGLEQCEPSWWNEAEPITPGPQLEPAPRP